MTGSKREIIEWLQNQNAKLFDIRVHHNKRSRNANSYAWVLITKIADTMCLSKQEVYEQMLEDYGQSEIVITSQGVKLKKLHEYHKLMREGNLNGQKACWWKILFGSSTYDTKEMAVFIDGIVQEAKQLDIETLPPDEIEQMKKLWDSQDEVNSKQ